MKKQSISHKLEARLIPQSSTYFPCICLKDERYWVEYESIPEEANHYDLVIVDLTASVKSGETVLHKNSPLIDDVAYIATDHLLTDYVILFSDISCPRDEEYRKIVDYNVVKAISAPYLDLIIPSIPVSFLQAYCENPEIEVTENNCKILTNASTKGWKPDLLSQFIINKEYLEYYIKGNCINIEVVVHPDTHHTMKSFYSLNDLVTNYEEGEISFIDAIAFGMKYDFDELDPFDRTEPEQIPSYWFRDMWGNQPTSQRLDWLFKQFNHLIHGILPS